MQRRTHNPDPTSAPPSANGHGSRRALTVRDVAERYGVSAHVVLAWLDSGELRGVNVAKSPAAKRPSWRIMPDAIAAFEALRTPGPALPRARNGRRKSAPEVIQFYR